MGLARSGKTEEAALESLLAYVARYAKSMGELADKLKAPSSIAGMDIVERVPGNATTDFGAPDAIVAADREPVSGPSLKPLIEALRASWRAFDEAAERAAGRTLEPSGPRGGGRTLAKMREHVQGSDAAYVSAIGGKASGAKTWAEVRDRLVDAVRARAAGELPERGPRGGERWPARYAVRRTAWHALDHAWELEDRSA